MKKIITTLVAAACLAAVAVPSATPMAASCRPFVTYPDLFTRTGSMNFTGYTQGCVDPYAYYAVQQWIFDADTIEILARREGIVTGNHAWNLEANCLRPNGTARRVAGLFAIADTPGDERYAMTAVVTCRRTGGTTSETA
jgi:hypothetical protein